MLGKIELPPAALPSQTPNSPSEGGANIACHPHYGRIPNPILYSLPDALWVYSFTAVMQYVWFQQQNRYGRMFWIFLPVSLGVGGEIGQLFKIVPGTFDPVDLFAYIAACVLASIFSNASLKKYKVALLQGDAKFATSI